MSTRARVLDSLSIYQVPSVYAHILNGLLLFAGVVYLFISRSRDSYQILVLILLFSMAVGIHGISHMGLEYVYGYNPLSVIYTKN
jgi:hypothetical protein